MLNRMTTRILTLVSQGILPAALLVTMFLSDAVSAPAGPEDVEWQLQEVAGRPAALPAGQKQPSLLLDAANKRASGFGGCNSFFCGYTLAGSSLTFGLVGSTSMACPDRETELERAFFGVLAKTREWKIVDNALLLMAGGKVLARFTTGEGDAGGVDPGSMTYRLKSVQTGPVTLIQGEYRAHAAPGSAAETVVTLISKQAFGLVQGREAGAVVLVVSTGGSGTFYELALLRPGAQGWSNTDTALLGDRVKVHSVLILNDQVVVAMTDHGPGDPLCCPTHEKTKRFAVRNDRLVPDAGQGER
jgi:heat shock protein HslJ